MMFFPASVTAPDVEPHVHETGRLVLDAISKALIRSRGDACYVMGLSEAHFAQSLNRIGFNLARLWFLPRAFWIEFLPLLAEAKGISLASTPADTARLEHLEQRLRAVERRSDDAVVGRSEPRAGRSGPSALA